MKLACWTLQKNRIFAYLQGISSRSLINYYNDCSIHLQSLWYSSLQDMEFNFLPFDCSLVLAPKLQQHSMKIRKNSTFTVEKLVRHHLIQIIKINGMNHKPCWYYIPPDLMRWGEHLIISLKFFPKTLNSKIIMRIYLNKFKLRYLLKKYQKWWFLSDFRLTHQSAF